MQIWMIGAAPTLGRDRIDCLACTHFVRRSAYSAAAGQGPL